MKLYTPNATYINQIETGKNYLNCPKFLFNEALHSIVRLQGKLALMGFLNEISYPNRKALLDEIYNNFIGVSPSSLAKVNVNSYLDKPLAALPAQCRATDSRIHHEVEMGKPIWDWIMWARGIKFDPNIHRQANSIKQFATGR